MFHRIFSSGRCIVLIAVLGTFVASLALLLCEASVVVIAVVAIVCEYSSSPKSAKAFAVGLIEAVDAFLIAIAVQIISFGLYALVVDDTLPLPQWLEIHDLDDLKSSLVSVVVAVLAVPFLREVMAWNGGHGLLMFGAEVTLIVAALTFYLGKNPGKKS